MADDNDLKVAGEIGALTAGIGSLEKVMTQQHASMNGKLDMLIKNNILVDQKIDTAFVKINKVDERVDNLFHPDYGAITLLKQQARRALEYGEDYNGNKKKVTWLASIVFSFGAFISWVVGVLLK